MDGANGDGDILKTENIDAFRTYVLEHSQPEGGYTFWIFRSLSKSSLNEIILLKDVFANQLFANVQIHNMILINLKISAPSRL